MESKNDIRIEVCKKDDCGRVAEIYNEYIQLGESTMEESAYSEEKIQAWMKKFNEKEQLYVIKKNEKIIGWGIIKRYSEREGYRFACETAIYITQGELRKGYGSKMKRFLLEQCEAFGYHHLVAKIFSSNTASIQYNLKLGYTIVGTQKEIGFKNGKWQDIVIMQYLIK